MFVQMHQETQDMLPFGWNTVTPISYLKSAHCSITAKSTKRDKHALSDLICLGVPH